MMKRELRDALEHMNEALDALREDHGKTPIEGALLMGTALVMTTAGLGPEDCDGLDEASGGRRDGKMQLLHRLVRKGICPWCDEPIEQPVLTAERELGWSCPGGCNP